MQSTLEIESAHKTGYIYAGSVRKCKSVHQSQNPSVTQTPHARYREGSKHVDSKNDRRSGLLAQRPQQVTLVPSRLFAETKALRRVVESVRKILALWSSELHEKHRSYRQSVHSFLFGGFVKTLASFLH